jgi:hypothetical protein
MSNSNRIFLYGPFVAVIAIAAAYSAYWFVVANRIDAALERTYGNEIVPGITLQFAEKEIGGFPFRFDVLLGGVTLASRANTGETAWRSERVALHAMSYGRELYLFETDGLQTVSWPAENGGAQNILQFTPGVARASAIIVDGRLARFDLDLINTEGRDALPNAAPDRAFSIVRAQLHLLAATDDTIALVISADGADVGSGFRPAFGPDVSRIRIEGDITEAQELAPLRAGTADFDEAFENWREAGGTIDLDPIEAAWGGTVFSGSTELQLDAEHRVTGLVTTQPEDPVSFLGALAQSEMLPQDARAQLGMLRDMTAGLGGSLDIPIRLETHLPLGDGPVTPQLRIEGLNGIVVMFGSAR